jgi:DNA-binding Lrp family transcriptional regulator
VEIAYVLINCELGSEKAILESLKHIDSVTEVHGTFGAYDIITKIESQDSDKLREIITLNIRNIKHVCSTLTLMGIPDQN